MSLLKEILLEMQEETKDKYNEEDTITMDIPMLVRMLELAREQMKDDMILHRIVDTMIEVSRDGHTLTMDDYDRIVKSYFPDSEDDEKDSVDGDSEQIEINITSDK